MTRKLNLSRIYCFYFILMILGGNQRELARAKNQKKQTEMSKKKGTSGDGLTLEQRKYRYLSLLRQI